MSLCVADAARELSEYVSNQNTGIFVSKSDGNITGFIALLYSLDTADILDIAVLPSHTRKGIGKNLLLHAFERCKQKDITEILLEVRASNTAAKALYESTGFERIHIRKNYYSAPLEDALIYRRKLI
jgi:ribosomal-protein-alanine N-acetyltransferase